MNGSASADLTSTEPDNEVPRTGRLSVAELRRAVPLRLWGGKGCGAPCDFCRVSVSESDIEYEIEAELEAQKITLHFHPRCHDAWRAGLEPPAEPQEQELAGAAQAKSGAA